MWVAGVGAEFDPDKLSSISCGTCGMMFAPLLLMDAGRGVVSFRGFLLICVFVAWLAAFDVGTVVVGALVVVLVLLAVWVVVLVVLVVVLVATVVGSFVV